MVVFCLICCALAAPALEPVPDKLVVLTFDDASKSHFTVARPLLLKHGFGATFFISEGWDFATNKRDYMSWEEIRQLHRDGFDIGNHTMGHTAVSNLRELPGQLRGIDERCREHGIPKPVTFAYPGNAISREALVPLKDQGILFARRGGSPEYPYKDGQGVAMEPGRDHPLLLPTAGDARPHWTIDNLKAAVAQARQGRIAVLQFHGVPDTAHGWVSTPADRFEAYMRCLAEEKCRVISMRDLSRFVDPAAMPADPFRVMEERKKAIASSPQGAPGSKP